MIGLLSCCTVLIQGTGRLHAHLTMDGVLVRDLQLRPSSKFAFLLRPLPARAAQLDSYATSFRRRILRVIGTSKAKKRCACMALRAYSDTRVVGLLHSG